MTDKKMGAVQGIYSEPNNITPTPIPPSTTRIPARSPSAPVKTSGPGVNPKIPSQR